MSYAVIGKNVPKVDAMEKALGRAVYINDMTLPGMLYGKVLRSSFAHARILHVDATRALELPGVRAVLTGEDLPGGRMGPFIKDEPVLAVGKVRYIGEPVAAVAAIDPDVAEEALGLIEVEYEELPAVFDPADALAPGAPLIHEELEKYLAIFPAIRYGNVCSQTTMVQGDVDAGFRQADVVVEETFRTQMHHHTYIEPSGAIAKLEPNGRFTVWTATQGVFLTQARISEALKIPMTKLRVVAPRVGGGFGGKIEPHVQPLCVALAQKTLKPVKMVFTREEELSCGRPRHPTTVTCKLGVKRDGTIVAKELHGIFDSGAYADDGPGVAGFGTLMGRGPYRVPHFKLEARCVYTNKVKTGAFRGFGNPQTTFASESVMDMAARELGMDPLEFRLKNALGPGDRSVGGQVLQSVGIQECLAKAADAIGWSQPREGKLRGRGIASVNHVSGLLTVSAVVSMNEDGTISLKVGTMDIGQGADTTLTQICAEELGVGMEDVCIVSGDTDAAPYTWATTASRLTYTAGNAVRRAAADAKRQILELAASTLEASPGDLKLAGGRVSVKGSESKGLSLFELGAISCWVKGGAIVGRSSFMVEEPVMDRSGFEGFPFGTMTAYIFAGQTAEVEVDVETGEVKVLRGAAAHDVGRAINPQNVEGQIEGGYAQGLGFALVEETVFDQGRVVNPTLVDYKIPSSMEVPPITPIIVEAADETGPFEAKGVGEPVLAGVAPAVANAIFDAVGVRITELPITPERVREALRKRGGEEIGP
ncbi:MAG: xanthine dehydrogenase family protein molybdopterin-binding subunit [Deltaproteobacteria bacterium]|nr:xanthine dehydrogenase family protein molybdopterin-binding subunit [Deltaproteobacteria bacterium]